jgi:hypothetical protein
VAGLSRSIFLWAERVAQGLLRGRRSVPDTGHGAAGDRAGAGRRGGPALERHDRLFEMTSDGLPGSVNFARSQNPVLDWIRLSGVSRAAPSLAQSVASRPRSGEAALRVLRQRLRLVILRYVGL